MIFPGFDLGAIFGSENLGALQIFFGVDVLVFFLLAFLARALLLGGVGDVLTVGLRSAKNSTRRGENCGKEERHRMARTTHGGRGVHRCWGYEIDSCHAKPTTGGHRLKRTMPDFGPFVNGNFLPLGPFQRQECVDKSWGVL